MLRPAAGSGRQALVSVRHRWPLLGLLAVTLVMVTPVATHDVRDLKPFGDQTSHVYLGLSLAYDSHTFNFDRRDAQRWQELGWVAEPFTLFFQRYDGGWAASKPYGYPAFLAPFIAALGPVHGLSIGNAVLLLGLVAGSLWLALRRFDALTAALAVGAFYFGGYIYMYAYPANVELFEAAITLAAYGGAYAFRSTGRVGWALLSVVAMAFGVVEKLPLLFLYAPLAAVILWELRRRRPMFVLVLALGLVSVGFAATPYLKYSDGNSFTPYAGERFQLVPNEGSRPPWAGGVLNRDFVASGADEGAIAKRATTGKALDRLESLAYYIVGRYTGLLVTVPLALFLLLAVIARLPTANRWGVAAVGGVLAYIAFYLVVFPTNYYGGGQSLGNRYFIQIAPAVFVSALFVPLGARTVRILSVAGVAISILMSWPQHRAPSDAYIEMIRTSPAQRLLPMEANQDYTWIFRQTPPEN